ncbi:HNH endonuclease [Sphingomonas sp. 1P06PA]|uniref:HNH endonuclease n=1 Tax=Sphingomonas sp. 1P06PA TaxID=554121 RepID=UPI0039A750BE
MGWGVADIPVANGTVLIGPISAIPGAFIRKTDVMATRRVLHLVRHSSAAMQELRREWAAISLLTVPERMTDDQLIQHVEYGVARRTLAVMLIARDQSNFVARPAEKPRLIQPESVADWTASEKIVAALRAAGGHLGGEMRRMIEELIDPVNVAVTVGLILALVAANAMGWGVIADAVLVIFAYAAAGIAGIKAIGQFIETTIDVIDARSASEIDQAGKEYAHAFRVLGTAFLARFLGKAKAKRAGATDRVPRGGSAKPATTPAAKPKPPPPPQSQVPTINGRKPINSRYAGQTHPSGVRFNERGFPDFSPHSKASVQLKGLNGNYAHDAALANKAVGLKQTPAGYVWHHVEDGRTLQLIPRDIHNAVRHTGGSSVIKNGGFD